MNIRVVSPSGQLDSRYLDEAEKRLRQWGHHVTEGNNARQQWGRFAGTDEQRLGDLNEALSDPQIDIVLCARGGYGMQRLIDRVHAISKPLIGFSDITELHQLAGIRRQPTIHAGMCKSIASGQNDALRPLLQGDEVVYDLVTDAQAPYRTGQVNACVIGGNLSVLYGLQATPYSLDRVIDQQTEPPILLIEDIAEHHYHIDRMMRNLRLSGVLARLGGLIVGELTDCAEDKRMMQTLYQTVWDSVADYDYPIAMNLPIGHGQQNIPLWLHTPTSLQVTAKQVLLQQHSPLVPVNL